MTAASLLVNGKIFSQTDLDADSDRDARRGDGALRGLGPGVEEDSPGR
ncbi:hypothetical protein [Streptomyces sp. NPDC001340]